MTTDWKAVADAMYIPLLTSGCRCQREKTWSVDPGTGELRRALITKCSRCVAVHAYQAAMEVKS